MGIYGKTSSAENRRMNEEREESILRHPEMSSSARRCEHAPQRACARRPPVLVLLALYLASSRCAALAVSLPRSASARTAAARAPTPASASASASRPARRRRNDRPELPVLGLAASSSPDAPDSGGDDEVVPRGGGSETSPPPPPPTFAQLRNFYVPCLALWIAGPLLSLVDTATVGLSAAAGTGAAQLGALGPATTFIDGSTYLFAFLNVATTNLYAGAMADNASRGKDAVDSNVAGDGVVRVATKISLICGFFLLGLLLRAGRFLLGVYIGGEAGPEVLTNAAEYVSIRALSMPTSLLGGVLQAALLGAKDSVTPLIAVIVSTIVNVLGDLLCVCKLQMGTKGAALATLFAQLAGTLAMLRPARRELLAPGGRKEAVEKVPDSRVSSASFLSFAAPVITLILGKLAAFGVMTHVAAALPGEASLAAHQIVLSLFFFLSPFLEVISQTAQAFLPIYFTKSDDERYADSADRLSSRLLRLGVVVGGGVSLLAASIPRFFPWMLTNDLGVQAAVRPLALPLALGGLLTAPVAVSEGILLARRELKFLAGTYLLTTALLPSVLFRIKAAKGPVVHIWACFAGFQLFRAAFFTGRLWGPKIAGMVGRAVTGKKGGEEGAAVATA